MIRKFIESIEDLINSSSIILSSQIQKHLNPGGNTVYLKGQVVFIDSSTLDMAIYITETRDTLYIDKYRFQYMNSREHFVFRYDNAPHHPEIKTFPDHKHLSEGIIPSIRPSFKDILNEISAFILSE
ncbi:MAG: DUF6516 family protein [Thermodesulfobacteriota bacterium]